MLIGFNKRFTTPIQIGTKVFTMRKRRKVRPKVGERMYMYEALRTKHTKLISNQEKLISIQNARILIEFIGYDFYDGELYGIRIFIDRRPLTSEEIYQFVRFDGFTDLRDFCRYWLTDSKGKKKKRTGSLKELYHWTDLRY